MFRSAKNKAVGCALGGGVAQENIRAAGERGTPLGGSRLNTLLYSCRRTLDMKEQLTAVFQQVPEGYIAFVEELPGANTQGGTLEEARANLREAVQLVLESNRALAEEALRNKTVIRELLASIS